MGSTTTSFAVHGLDEFIVAVVDSRMNISELDLEKLTPRMTRDPHTMIAQRTAP